MLAQGEGELFFHGGSEVDGFDFPTEPFAGALGELRAQTGLIDAGAFDLGKREQREKLGFDLGERLIEEFEAQAVISAVDRG